MTDEALYPQYPISFVTGDTWRRSLQVTDPDPASPDPDNPIMVPRDLTGWSARAQVRLNARPTTAVTATFEVSGFGPDGVILLHLPPDESRKVTRKSGWDLELIAPDGDVTTILGGPVTPIGDYTK